MKLNKIKFTHSGTISKYRALTDVAKAVSCLHIVPVMEAFFSSVSSREKLQIIYANIRV
jgi:hypothetical protein